MPQATEVIAKSHSCREDLEPSSRSSSTRCGICLLEMYRPGWAPAAPHRLPELSSATACDSRGEACPEPLGSAGAWLPLSLSLAANPYSTWSQGRSTQQWIGSPCVLLVIPCERLSIFIPPCAQTPRGCALPKLVLRATAWVAGRSWASHCIPFFALHVINPCKSATGLLADSLVRHCPVVWEGNTCTTGV